MNIPFLDPDYRFDRLSNTSTRRKLIADYYSTSIDSYHQKLLSQPEEFWLTQGEKKALNLFHLASQHVPAYKDFLHRHHIKPSQIKTISDFRQVPLTDKPNYISHYPLESLCWHGHLREPGIVSYSSGATGQPYLWPRSIYQDYEGAFQFEHILTYLFEIDKKSTLFVNCFSMGNYVAGVYVYTSVKLLSAKGYPITLVSPGINYQDALNMLNKLSSKFDQIILAGYPPFIRDLIEIGNETGFNFKKHNLKFFFASEFFSETWRDHTLNLAGNKSPLTDSTNIYGTADSAIFSTETPTTIAITKLAHQNPQLSQDLFSSNLSPTLTQYNPLLTYYESVSRELALTCNSGIPLIRYDLKDEGDILPVSTASTILTKHNLNLSTLLSQTKLPSPPNQLPMVFITNRTDGAISFYAITIFPEYIRGGLETKPLHPYLSGKFTLVAHHDRHQKPQLIVHVELNHQISPTASLTTEVLHSVQKELRHRCSEYNFLEQSIGKRAVPKIILHPKNHSQYFKVGIKQKWVIK